MFSNVLSFAQISVDGLIRNYTFTGNANDSSGFNFHGDVTNAILTADRFNAPNSAYSFNGQTSYIDIPFIGLDLLEYTYSVWANTATLPPVGTGTIVLAIGTAYYDQVINTNNSVGVNTGWGGNGYNETGPAQYIAYSGESLVANEWVHIVMVRDVNKLRCYIDCRLVKTDSTNQTHAPGYGFNQLAKIGARQNNVTKFNGKIDDLRIYNRALSYNEIILLCEEKQSTSLSYVEDKNPISVFPNPAFNEINLINQGPNKINSLSILNGLGQIQEVTETVNQNTISIDVLHLTSGIYYLIINFNNGEKRIEKISIIK